MKGLIWQNKQNGMCPKQRLGTTLASPVSLRLLSQTNKDTFLHDQAEYEKELAGWHLSF